MTDHNFYILVSEAVEENDRDVFVSDGALSQACDGLELEEAATLCGKIWDAVHIPFSEIRARMALTQVAMAERLCVPRRTLENWEYRNNCPLYIRIMIFRLWLGLLFR